jgi:hypothetical protein
MISEMREMGEMGEMGEVGEKKPIQNSERDARTTFPSWFISFNLLKA